jgi:hypothetical protein
VRGALAWLVSLIASCAPDYAHTTFLCPPGHDCPPGQSCVDGRCRHGAVTGDGVVCPAPAGTCAAGGLCCLDRSGNGHCDEARDACTTGPAALCDGSEDCQPGDRCCADGNTAFCDAVCMNYVCRDAADCPASAPNCCPDPITPWHQCSPFGC